MGLRIGNVDGLGRQTEDYEGLSWMIRIVWREKIRVERREGGVRLRTSYMDGGIAGRRSSLGDASIGGGGHRYW